MNTRWFPIGDFKMVTVYIIEIPIEKLRWLSTPIAKRLSRYHLKQMVILKYHLR